MITPAATSSRLRRRVALSGTVLLAAGLAGTTACSSTADDTASIETTAAATAPPPPTPQPPPPTTAAPAPPTSEPPVPPSAEPTDPPTTDPPSTTAAPPAVVAPDPAQEAQLREILATHHASGEFVGARIAVRGTDGAVTEVGAGTPTLDPSSGPVELAVPWNIGSATKTFVAVVVMQLAEEGRIDLDDGIDGYVPDLAGADRLTPRQLLNHTSGLAEYLAQPAVITALDRRWTPAELIAAAEAAGRVAEPGGPHRYSNTNYIVLGEIIEQVTGRPWQDEVDARIIQPLGMTRTSLITDTVAPGFELVDGALAEVTSNLDASVGGAAGGLQSTSRDLLAFAAALADGSLVSPASEEAMHTFLPAEDLSRFGIDHGYGLGLERYVMDGMTVIGHMGTGMTGTSYVGYDLERGTAVAVTTNTAIDGPAALMAVETLTALREAG